MLSDEPAKTEAQRIILDIERVRALRKTVDQMLEEHEHILLASLWRLAPQVGVAPEASLNEWKVQIGTLKRRGPKRKLVEAA